MGDHENVQERQPVNDETRLVRTPLDRPLAAHRARKRIERALHSRVAPKGTTRGRIESTVKGGGERIWSELKRHPSIGVAAAAGLGLTAALVIGVGELAFGVAAGYAAYEVLKEGMPLPEAVKDARDLVE
jgi:hypothetical protein